MSRISYGITIWGSSHQLLLKNIFKLQKRGIRYLQKIKQNDTCKPHFKELQIMTVPSLYIYQTVLFIQNNKQNYPTLGRTHQYTTRNRQQLAHTQHRTRQYEQQVHYKGVDLYNKTPQHIQNAPIETFKKLLKNYLIDRCIYKIEDY